ncbi:MAG TPA: heparan-alpha-glucosaminide N-acetyltransferase domain-containing protein [Gemmatimonadaceae bacterium]|nr:heparan-alpha-glucosaminide N-acetyltransferase domain-containing protein [Gemmatimonadaceae bacterium]
MSTVVSPTGTRTPAGTYALPDVAERVTGRSAAAGSSRIGSIDIIRGAVMVLMAIDHVRVFSGVPAGGPTPGVFFTRWVTHFCAPAFIFLAGTSAFLYGEKVRDRGVLARFLLTRGAWLVLLELTVLRFAWTFNFDYAHYALAGVIWVIGWCMILMAALVYLPVAAIAAIGASIIALHNVTDLFRPELVRAASTSSLSWFWQILYFGGDIALSARGEDGPQLAVLYSIIPWIGVMAAGFAFGRVMRLDPARRRRVCIALGMGAIATFLVIRGFNLYGDPRPWGAAARGAAAQRFPAPPAILQFLATNKYPASLLFLLMTLGPTILLIPVLEPARGRVARVLTVFGRVPFFYYVLHIPLIHLVFVALSIARYGEVIPWMTTNHPMFVPPPPPGYTYSLAALYAITVLVVTALYFPCRWFAGLKARRAERWLSYL